MLSEIQIETISRKLNATLLLILPYMFHKIATDSITFFSHSLFTTKFEQKCSWINFQFTKILKFRFQRQIVLECKNEKTGSVLFVKAFRDFAEREGAIWDQSINLGPGDFCRDFRRRILFSRIREKAGKIFEDCCKIRLMKMKIRNGCRHEKVVFFVVCDSFMWSMNTDTVVIRMN